MRFVSFELLLTDFSITSIDYELLGNIFLDCTSRYFIQSR